MLVELFCREASHFLVQCVRDCGFVEVRHVQDEDAGMKFVKSGSVSGEFCPTFSDLHGS